MKRASADVSIMPAKKEKLTVLLGSVDQEFATAIKASHEQVN